MSREMKDSGVIWIGEIPDSWKVIKVKNKYTNNKEIVGSRVDCFERLSLTLNGVLKRPKDDSEGLQPQQFEGYQILRENELVFKLIDLENVRTSRVGLSPYIGIVSPAYIILNNENESKFGYYYFLSMWQREVFNKLGGDGVRSNLSAKDLLNLPYLDISENEKEKIVRYLDEKVSDIDNIINNTNKTIEEYRDYKKSLITEVVLKGIDSKTQTKDSQIEHIGEIPLTWDIIKLKYILGERSEKSISGIEEPLSMSQKYGLIRTRDMESIPNATSSYVGNKIVKYNDLVFNKLKAHLGVFSVSQYEGIVSPDYAVYYSKGNVNVKYLEFLFKTPIYINEFKKYSRGAAQGLTRLYTTELFNIKIAIPSLEEQNNIIGFIEKKCKEIDKLIAKKEELIIELENYKKSLIYECVTGKKEI